MASNVILNKDQEVLEKVGMPNGTTLEWLLFTFEMPRKRLIDWMVKGREEHTLVSVEGMEKPLLPRKFLTANMPLNTLIYFRIWITMSQSFSVEGLLRDMLLNIYIQNGKKILLNIFFKWIECH